VTFGLAATAADMSLAGAAPAAFQQVGLLGGAGAAVGAAVASKVGPTELPQTVAAFHSLVGIAAMAGAAGEYLGNVGQLDGGTLGAIYLAVFIGGITFTGSIVAFGKLSGIVGSAPLQLPGRDQLNLAMISVIALGMAAFLNPTLGSSVGLEGLSADTLQLSSLSVAAAVSSVLGVHLVASIGGPDMPVIITVLNSYSGWALVAEGFLLGNPLLCQVGALIHRVLRSHPDLDHVRGDGPEHHFRHLWRSRHVHGPRRREGGNGRRDHHWERGQLDELAPRG